jgi:ribosomal protein S18 acetylase RimI-like enzyme
VRVTIKVELLDDITIADVEAFKRLLPQLSSSAELLDHAALERIVNCPVNTVLVARSNGEIVGTLTLVMFPLPSGLRARIEDVVVDESARGMSVGESLSRAALQIARESGARTVDLTSRPSRSAANRLYQRLGFELRNSQVYRFSLQE